MLNKNISISLITILILGSIVIADNVKKDLNIGTVRTDKQIEKTVDNYANEVVEDYFTTKIDDINKLLNDDVIGYIYFGRDTCPNCLNFNRFLEREYNKNEELLIFKFDTDFWRENEFFRDVLNKYGVSGVPTLMKVNRDNSYLVFNPIGENEDDIQTNLHNFLYE